jgi:hypothetical protein
MNLDRKVKPDNRLFPHPLNLQEGCQSFWIGSSTFQMQERLHASMEKSLSCGRQERTAGIEA